MKDNRPPVPRGKPGQDLAGRKILLGVSGGIAAYKAVELTRLLIKNGARVQVVMTEAATKFVTPLTFETITGRHVFVEMFPPHGDFSPWHTEMASWPDLAVIAPATANHMARLAAGIADDLLSTILLTLDRPRLLCPSMNHRMWANPATQDNAATLKRRGYRFVLPEEGQMARPGEDEGIGRLAEPETIYRETLHLLSAPQDLRGVRVLVTAGRTEESWDPVRVLTNRASGRMGFALAEEARERGADVILIHGPTDVIPPSGMRIRRVTTALEMAQAVKQEFPQSKIVLMAAAVADYTFAKTAEHKIKKGGPAPELQLVPTEDILRSLADKKGDRIVVGFALETENLLENALKKLREKHLDIVVANNPLTPGSGFAGETNQVILIHRSGRVNDLPLQSKREAAREILNSVIELYRNPEPELEMEPAEAAEDSLAAFEEDLDEPLPIPAAQRHPEPAPPREHDRNRRDKKRRGKHHRDQQRPAPVEGQAPQPEPAPEVSAPSPVEQPLPAEMIEPPLPVPAPVPQAPVAETALPEPVAMDSTQPEHAGAELPFPNGTTPGGKKSRSRRGGRRSARARAARHQQSGTPSPASPEQAPAQPVTAEPVAPPRPEKRAPAPPPPPAPVPEAPPQPVAVEQRVEAAPVEITAEAPVDAAAKKSAVKRGRRPAAATKTYHAEPAAPRKAPTKRAPKPAAAKAPKPGK